MMAIVPQRESEYAHYNVHVSNNLIFSKENGKIRQSEKIYITDHILWKWGRKINSKEDTECNGHIYY